MDVWIKPVADEPSYHVGVTDHFIVNRVFGDVDAIRISDGVDAEQPHFEIDWSGMKVGEGDELYHSVWSNEEGSFTLKPQQILAPDLQYTVLEMNKELTTDVALFDDNTWLFKVSFTAP